MLHSNFVHLHVHTQYSLLDGACLIPNLVSQAVEFKMPALAITDHGNLFGAIEFYGECMRQGLKPIIGCEVYIAPHSRFDKTPSGGIKDSSSHLILLAKDEEGYKNLMKLVTIGYLEGFYYKPRIDKALLAQHSKGLIVLTSCLKGAISYLALERRYEEATKWAKDFLDIFGRENFYLELQNHGLANQLQANRFLLNLSQQLNLQVVATNDVHYLIKAHARSHEILLCIQTQTTLNDPNRMRYETDEFYLKSADEMNELFKEIPEAIHNSIQITERCNLELDFTEVHLPNYEPPSDISLEAHIRSLCEDGLKKRYPVIDKTILNRLEHELGVIRKADYTSYFLIVADLVKYAKGQGIPVGPGRGSSAGSLVSYVLGITDIDPLRYGLLFERFLNPERVSLPDIDIDFCYERRGEVIDYVVRKYGKENVAQIITFGTMLARAVVRDVGRVMEIPYAEVDRIAKLIPSELGITLIEAIHREPELAGLYKNNPTVKQLLDIAFPLEGLTRHASTHAAGIVITDKSLTEYMPLFKGSEDEVTTGYSMGSLEKIGLLKIDLLGLRTLTVIDEAVKIIKRTKGIPVDIDSIPLDDNKTFGLLSDAETIGIFQLESPGMRDLLKKLKPTRFEDIVALLALYRPGPIGSGMLDEFMRRKHGYVPIKYDHPKLEPIIKETYGILVYQEQCMQLASQLAGFSLSQADLLRQAMGKKIPEVMEEQRKHFIAGCVRNNISKTVADRIFDLMEHFAGYGFNKCVAGSTRIIDADTGKIITVKELYDKKYPAKHTFSCSDDLKIVKARIKGVFENGRKPVYKLRTALGKEIIATNNHPFFTINGWKYLQDICIGEKIGLARCVPFAENDISYMENYKLVALAGILSEGNACHPSGVYFYNNNKVLIEDFVTNAKKFTDTEPTIRIRSSCYEVYCGTGRDSKFYTGQIPWNKGSNKTTYSTAKTQIVNRKSGLRLWVEDLNLHDKKASEKFIPSEIFSLHREQLALFLGRLWSGDGFIFSKNNTIPFYASSSLVLCQQLQELLLKFAIASRIRPKKFNYKYKRKTSYKIGYALYLYGRKSISAFISYISPHIIGKEKQIQQMISYYKKVSPDLESKDTLPPEIKYIVKQEKEKLGLSWKELENKTGICMKEFYGRVKSHKKGFRRKTIHCLAQFFESQRLLSLVNADIIWDSAESIEFAGNDETYDLEIDQTHNFVANGIIVHNSHSCAYAMISYRTAYLKANFQPEFMTALLTSEMGNTDKVALYIDESKRMGLEILPPDVNESFTKFTLVGKSSIRFGLIAIKNVGLSAIDSIVKARQNHGTFKNLCDFCERVDSRLVNRKVLESLIKSGAMDSFSLSRAQLMAGLDKTMELAAGIQKDRLTGQLSFFDRHLEYSGNFKDDLYEVTPVKEWSDHQRLNFEKELLGFYISGHPIARFEKLIRGYSCTDTSHLTSCEDLQEVMLGGIITRLKQTVTKKTNERMAICILEDLGGFVEALIFPGSYQINAPYLHTNSIVFVKGRVSRKEDKPKIIVDRVTPVEEIHKQPVSSAVIRLKEGKLDEQIFEQLKNVLLLFKGDVPVSLEVSTQPNLLPSPLSSSLSSPRRGEGGVRGEKEWMKGRGQSHSGILLKAGESLRVQPAEGLISEVEKLLGRDTIKFILTSSA